MSQLSRTHVGWENEHLATYMLSRIGFVARPATIGDDVGTDLFCTLFDVEARETHEALVPRSSIAVQIKSSLEPVDATKNVDYLTRLEVPYYLGFVNQHDSTLSIYSARHLPLLLSFVGNPKRLRLVPVEASTADYKKGDRDKGFDLMCPRVGAFGVSDDRATLAAIVTKLKQDAEQALKAIVSRLNKEFIFDAPDGRIEMFAGPVSAIVFHENFMKRLAEALYNLAWLGTNAPQERVDLYTSILQAVERAGHLPDYLRVAKIEFAQARDRIAAPR